jgi:hypothetical protein
MSLKSIYLIFVFVVILNGCASALKHPSSTANFGSQPQNYEQAIKSYFEVILKDPDSAKYRFSAPVKAYGNEGLIYGGDVSWLGWLVDVDVNAKNSYGGYTGAKQYMVFFKGDRVFKHVKGRDHILLHRY